MKSSKVNGHYCGTCITQFLSIYCKIPFVSIQLTQLDSHPIMTLTISNEDQAKPTFAQQVIGYAVDIITHKPMKLNNKLIKQKIANVTVFLHCFIAICGKTKRFS